MAFQNKAQFTSGLQNWAKAQQVSNKEACLMLALNLAENIIRGTPVDTGWARANWWPSINKMDVPPNAGKPNPRTSTAGLSGKAKASAQKSNGEDGAQASLSRAAGTFAGGNPGDKFILSNGVPYINRLEYGWSKQAPQGMVRVAILKAKTFLDGFADKGTP